MTIAVIVACKDSFYIITDTLTRGDSSYTLNTQKVFLSSKHKIAMCFADEAVLKYAGISKTREVLYVDFIIKEFFKYIDTLSELPIELMEKELVTFFLKKFPLYLSDFQEKVSYFYGGFKNGEAPTTAIYCHHKGNYTEYYFSETEGETAFYFSNTNVVEKYVEWTLKIPGTPEGMTSRKLLMNPENRINFLTFTIPHACLALNAEEPYYIGSHLHYTNVRLTDAVITRAIKYSKSDSAIGVSCKLDPTDMPIYLSYRSYQESNNALISGELIRYSVEDGSKIAPPSEGKEEEKEEKSSSDASYYPSLIHPASFFMPSATKVEEIKITGVEAAQSKIHPAYFKPS